MKKKAEYIILFIVLASCLPGNTDPIKEASYLKDITKKLSVYEQKIWKQYLWLNDKYVNGEYKIEAGDICEHLRSVINTLTLFIIIKENNLESKLSKDLIWDIWSDFGAGSLWSSITLTLENEEIILLSLKSTEKISTTLQIISNLKELKKTLSELSYEFKKYYDRVEK